MAVGVRVPVLMAVGIGRNHEKMLYYNIKGVHRGIQVPENSREVLAGPADSKFSQLVRNLKSHKTTKTRFIYPGYAESIPNGFRITERGRDFVKEYFSGV
jgi:hypothetical protein